MILSRFVAPLAVVLALASTVAAQSAAQILVFDGSVHGFALQAAQADHPTGVTVATSADFQSKLTTGTWDAVVLNMPGSGPTAAYPDLIAYINGGGKAVLALWDWDNNSGFGSAALNAAFEVAVAQDTTLVNGVTQLQDSLTSNVFLGVTMPVSDWHSHSSDDGDLFTPQGSGVGLAHTGNPAQPILVLGNQGRTIAAPLLSEAGDTWVNDGSALKLWSNLIDQVLTGGCPPSPATVVKRFGFPANPDAFQATAGSQPLLGKVFSCHVDHTTFMPGAILDVVSMSLGQMNLSTIHGTLLVDPTQQIGFQFTSAGQVFDLKAPFDCAFAGLTVSLQVGSVAVDALELTNSLDLTLGTQ